jgi:hypothetical protein
MLVGEADNVWEYAPIAGAMGLWGTQGSNILWTIADDTLHGLEDTVSGPVTLLTPSDDSTVAGMTSATLTWEDIADANGYEIGGTAAAFAGAFADVVAGVASVGVSGLTDNSDYTWKIRVMEGSPFQSRWSATWTFTTTDTVAPPIPAPRLVPANGAYNVPVEGPAFAWDPDGAADGFNWELSADPAFVTLIDSADLTVPYIVYDGTLDNNTAYYWRVNAYTTVGGVSTWVTSVFTTEAPAADPITIPPSNPPTQVTLTIPADETPSYIWAIIAIGGLLTIAVIILIVRTRRVV